MWGVIVCLGDYFENDLQVLKLVEHYYLLQLKELVVVVVFFEVDSFLELCDSLLWFAKIVFFVFGHFLHVVVPIDLLFPWMKRITENRR
jgi:hypothetical protein